MYLCNKKISQKQLVLQNSTMHYVRQWYMAYIALTKRIVFFKSSHITNNIIYCKDFLSGIRL